MNDYVNATIWGIIYVAFITWLVNFPSIGVFGTYILSVFWFVIVWELGKRFKIPAMLGLKGVK